MAVFGISAIFFGTSPLMGEYGGSEAYCNVW